MTRKFDQFPADVQLKACARLDAAPKIETAQFVDRRQALAIIATLIEERDAARRALVADLDTPPAARLDGWSGIMLTAHLKAQDTTGRTWRHKVRGTCYVEVGRGLTQSHESGLDEWPVVVYRGLDDGGKLWVRPVEEFEDGRFERVDAEPCDHRPGSHWCPNCGAL